MFSAPILTDQKKVTICASSEESTSPASEAAPVQKEAIISGVTE